LIDCLEIPGNKKKFVDAFENDDDGCVTYFRFRKLCEEIGIKIDSKNEWIYSDLEKHLDN